MLPLLTLPLGRRLAPNLSGRVPPSEALWLLGVLGNWVTVTSTDRPEYRVVFESLVFSQKERVFAALAGLRLHHLPATVEKPIAVTHPRVGLRSPLALTQLPILRSNQIFALV